MSQQPSSAKLERTAAMGHLSIVAATCPRRHSALLSFAHHVSLTFRTVTLSRCRCWHRRSATYSPVTQIVLLAITSLDICFLIVLFCSVAAVLLQAARLHSRILVYERSIPLCEVVVHSCASTLN